MKHTRALHIMLVEDNDSLREAIADLLRAEGHQITAVVMAEEVDDTPTRDVPDLYLIDVNLPGENGFSLAERVRASQPLVGIVLMTARAQLNDRLQGYSAGADIYLIKPVEPAELIACINNLGHRLKPLHTSEKDTISLESASLKLSGPGGAVDLTQSEAVLLISLSRAAGQKLERWQVMRLIDPEDKGLVPANLEMRISSLRKKLSACGAGEGAIRTLRGFGYALSATIQVL